MIKRSRTTVAVLLLVAIASCVAAGDPQDPTPPAMTDESSAIDKAEHARISNALKAQSLSSGDATTRDQSKDAVWYGIDFASPLAPHVSRIVGGDVDGSSVTIDGIRGGRLPPPPNGDEELVLKPTGPWTRISYTPRWGSWGTYGECDFLTLATGDIGRKEAVTMVQRISKEIADRLELGPAAEPIVLYGEWTLVVRTSTDPKDGKAESDVVKYVMVNTRGPNVTMSIAFDREALRTRRSAIRL